MKQKTTNRTMRVMTGTLALAVMLSGFATFDAGARLPIIDIADGPADCEGDPCAATSCTCKNGDDCDKAGQASAHAVGSEHAWAKATVGEWENKMDGPGTVHASAAGKGSPSASAKGKKDWSLKEANSSCKGPSAGETLAVFDDLVSLESEQALESLAFSLRCTADARIDESVSFVGRVHATAGGAFALVDGDGNGIRLEGLDMRFHGESFDDLVPVDLTTYLPTSLAIGVDIVEGGDLDTCSAYRL